MKAGLGVRDHWGMQLGWVPASRGRHPRTWVGHRFCVRLRPRPSPTDILPRPSLPAAAFLGGVMRMSASMCLILMEMTGAPGTLPFLMAVLVIAKGVGDRFNYRSAGAAC
jgi:hypothetical protein